MRYLKRYDVYIIIFVVLLGLSSLLLLKPKEDASIGKIVYIYSDNVLIETVDMTAETRYNHDVQTKVGHNLVVVNSEGVYIQEADCRDLICVKDGMITKVGEVLVCLPHKLLIEIKGRKEQEIDGISQ